MDKAKVDTNREEDENERPKMKRTG
jgi:hypothetical protein